VMLHSVVGSQKVVDFLTAGLLVPCHVQEHDRSRKNIGIGSAGRNFLPDRARVRTIREDPAVPASTGRPEWRRKSFPSLRSHEPEHFPSARNRLD
jgi:hypothetical protein